MSPGRAFWRSFDKHRFALAGVGDAMGSPRREFAAHQREHVAAQLEDGADEVEAPAAEVAQERRDLDGLNATATI